MATKKDPSEVFSQNATALREGQTIRVPGGELTFMSISPAFAKDLLEHRHNKQRKVKPEHVDRLAKAMADGKWRHTLDTIRFDKDFNLIDGQHRLLAIIKSGVTLKLMVAMLEDTEAFYAFDQGVIRSLRDIRTTQGKRNYDRTVMGAILLEHSDFGSYRNTYSKEEQDQILDEFVMVDDVLALNQLGKSGKLRLVNVGSLAVAIKCLRVNREDAMKFFNAVFTMKSVVDGEEISSAYLLYSWLVGRKTEAASAGGMTGEYFVRESAFKTMRAWNAWRKGERLGRLQYAPGAKVPKAMK